MFEEEATKLVEVAERLIALDGSNVKDLAGILMDIAIEIDEKKPKIIYVLDSDEEKDLERVLTE